MINTIEAIVKDGQIVPIVDVELIEGTRALITIVEPDEDTDLWFTANEESLSLIWDNEEDDIYAELLKK